MQGREVIRDTYFLAVNGMAWGVQNIHMKAGGCMHIYDLAFKILEKMQFKKAPSQRGISPTLTTAD